MTLLLLVLAGLAAVALGVFLGRPGRQDQRWEWEAREGRRGESGRRRRARGGRPERRGGRAAARRRIGVHDEKVVVQLEAALGRAPRRAKATKRHFTPLDLLRRDRRASQQRRRRRYFTTAAPTRKGRGKG